MRAQDEVLGGLWKTRKTLTNNRQDEGGRDYWKTKNPLTNSPQEAVKCNTSPIRVY